MLQIDLLNKSLSLKLQCTEKKIKAINPAKKQLFGESSCSKSHPCKSPLQMSTAAILKKVYT